MSLCDETDGYVCPSRWGGQCERCDRAEKNVVMPRPSAECREAMARAPSLEATMRLARNLESRWLLEDWSDAQQAQHYVDASWVRSQRFFGS